MTTSEKPLGLGVRVDRLKARQTSALLFSWLPRVCTLRVSSMLSIAFTQHGLTMKVCFSLNRRVSCLVLTTTLGLLIHLSQVVFAAPPENPIQRFFGQFDDDLKAWEPKVELAQQQRDQIDLRPQQRPDDVRRLTQIKRLIRQENWLEAVQLLQTILEQPTDAFFLNEERQFESIAELVESMIRDLPADGQRAYHNLFDPPALAAFESARQSGNEAELQKVLRRFPLTPAVQPAARMLIDLFVDRGEFTKAARLSHQLESLVSAEERLQIRKQTLVLFAKAGNRQRIAELGTEAVDDKVLQGIVESSLQGFLNQDAPKPIPTKELALSWSEPLIGRYSVNSQIDQLRSDLKSSLHERALIPTLTPLVVGDSCITKRLDGLAAYDLRSGKTIWSVASDNVEERLTVNPNRAESSFQQGEKITPYSSEALDYHPLASLLFRDSLWPSLATDGQHIYSIESNDVIDSTTVGNTWQSWARQDDIQREQWKSNELVARRVDNGNIVWRLGGPQLEDRFSRRMAGTFLLGAPFVHNEELLVLGEQDGEVILFSLSAYSGDVLWSQPVITPGIAINENIVRRFWKCQPVLHDGVILCPTGAGWLTAVDHTTHRLLWTLRFPIRTDHLEHFRRGPATPSLLDLNQRWSNPTILVDGRTVLFTPPELPDEFGLTNPFLVAVDLETGEQLWKVSKHQGLYLAGLHKKSAIVVGEKWIEAYMLDREGATLWKTSLSSHGIPSGMGMFNGDHYLLPVNDTTLLTIALQTGEVVQTEDLSYMGDQLGNLLAYDDSIVVASPENLMRLVSQSDAPDSWNMVKRDVERLSGQGKTREALDRLSNTTPTESEKSDFDRMYWEVLVAHVEANLGAQDLPFDELQRRSNSTDRMARYLGLRADQQTKLKEWDAATKAYVELLNQSEPTFIREQSRQVRSDVWARGKLLDLLDVIPPKLDEQRAFIQSQLPSAGDASQSVTPKVSSSSEFTWGHDWKVRRGSSNELNLQALDVFGDSHKPFRFRYDTNRNQLHIEDAVSGRLYWLLTMRSFETLQEQPTANVTIVGTTAYILHRGVLHALNLPEKKVLWTHVPEVNELNATRLRSPYHNPDRRMNNRSVVLATDRMRNKETGYFLAATRNVVLVHYEELIGLDAATGQVLWKDASVPANVTATVLADNFVLMNRSQHEVRRDFDGRAVSHQVLEFDLDHALALDESSIVLFEENKNSDLQVRRVNFTDAANLWAVNFPARTTFRRVDANELYALHPDGTLKVCQLKTGDVREIGSVREQALRSARETSLLTDQSGDVFLVIDNGGEGGDYNRIPAVRANGGFYRFSAEKSWSSSTAEFVRSFPNEQKQDEEFPDSWTLLSQDFEYSPLLVFTSSKPQREDDLHFRMLRMITVDKRTGETVISWTRASDSGGFSYFGVDLAKRQLLLMTYNENLLIHPVQN